MALLHFWLPDGLILMYPRTRSMFYCKCIRRAYSRPCEESETVVDKTLLGRSPTVYCELYSIDGTGPSVYVLALSCSIPDKEPYQRAWMEDRRGSWNAEMALGTYPIQI